VLRANKVLRVSVAPLVKVPLVLRVQLVRVGKETLDSLALQAASGLKEPLVLRVPDRPDYKELKVPLVAKGLRVRDYKVRLVHKVLLVA